MLRMIRSARSRLGRDQLEQGDDASLTSSCAGTDRGGSSGSAAPLQQGSVRWYTEVKPLAPSECSEQPGDLRPPKRVGTARSMLGGGRQRLARSRSAADQLLLSRGSENAAPKLPPPATATQLPPPATAPMAVLSDVTNTAGHLAPCPKPAFGGAILKPVHAGRESLPTPTLAQPPALAPVPTSVRGAQAATPPAAAPTPPESPGELEADVTHAEDPQHVVEYIPDIYKCLAREEALLQPEPSYMDKQPHVNAKMRAILVDWLVDVHKKYKLGPQTLFLAINIVDRYLEKKATARRHLQLVGVTALLVAAKFEELYPPQIHDFVYVTDKAYTKEEVIKMEVSMLTALDFKICRPTAMHFLERYQYVNGCTEAHRDLTNYLLELTLIDYKMVKYAPSHLAAAAVLLSNKLLRRTPSWTATAVKHTKMTEQSLKECAKEMCGLLEHAETHALQAVRKKYSQLKHHAVAKLNFSGAPSGASMAEEARRPGRRSVAPRRSSVASAPMELTPAPTGVHSNRDPGHQLEYGQLGQMVP